MRNDLIESLVIGGSIGFVVLAIHALTDGAPAQLRLLALLVAGIGLFCAQLALGIRRTRRSGAPHEEQPQQAPAPLQRAGRRRNPFFRELTHDWTGLDEHIVDRSATDSAPLVDQLGDLWDERRAIGDLPAPRPPSRRAANNEELHN
jgi:hypothetical protein